MNKMPCYLGKFKLLKQRDFITFVLINTSMIYKNKKTYLRCDVFRIHIDTCFMSD